MRQLLKEMYAVMVKAIELSVQAVHNNDQRAVEEVVGRIKGGDEQGRQWGVHPPGEIA